ncbi:MAG: NAD(P)H-binding protein [Paracoccaceae bacterium]|nr:NAD(P)H-binding protein [Paracoccaceae bacterium]
MLATAVNTGARRVSYPLGINSKQGKRTISDKPILVIGATGKTGSRVAAKLDALGLFVRRGSRRSETPFDWEAPETWGPALSGVRAVYVTYFPDLAFPGGVEKVGALAGMAKEAGVERLVLLSGRGEHHAKLGEEAVRAAHHNATIVRSTWFAQNFSEGYLRDPILAGVLPMPGGAITDPIIDIDDVADVVVAALTEEGHGGEVYEVTGPRLMGWADMAEELSRAVGRPIQHVPISFEDFHANVAASGGDFVADVFTAIARETLDGRNEQVCDGVERALGRSPRDFTEFAVDAAKAGAWSEAA